jgi:hypothetical protein
MLKEIVEKLPVFLVQKSAITLRKARDFVLWRVVRV